MAVEPVPDEPAAVADCGDERVLLIADYHAGIEVGLRREGVELSSRGGERRRHLVSLVDRTAPDRVAVLGDLGHAIGEPSKTEREEVQSLLTALTDRVSVTLLKGNHDGDIGSVVEGLPCVSVVEGEGTSLGDVGLAHGHTWPGPDALDSAVLCVGHEHPVVRLEDGVGGHRMERAWLRGGVDPEPFRELHRTDLPVPDRIVVFPAFNDLSGGTWINVGGQEFLSPFLPEAVVDAEAYLLDGTRLGDYRAV